MNKETGLGLMSLDELKTMLKWKLKNGWIIFSGDVDAFSIIENTVYTPRTSENKFFEIVMHPMFIGCGFAIGKRTKKLEEFLGATPDLDRTVALIFHKKMQRDDGWVNFITEQIYMKPDYNVDSAINRFVEDNLSK